MCSASLRHSSHRSETDVSSLSRDLSSDTTVSRHWVISLSLLSSSDLLLLVCCWRKHRSKKNCMAMNSRLSRAKKRCFFGNPNTNRSFRRISIKFNRFLRRSNSLRMSFIRLNVSCLVEHIVRRILRFSWRPMSNRLILMEHREPMMERRILFFQIFDCSLD